MAKVFEGERTFLHPVLRWLEVLTYKVVGVKGRRGAALDPIYGGGAELQYFRILAGVFHPAGASAPPFNPQHFGGAQVTPDLAFNTSASFVTNTNWQSYSRETTMSYFVEMVGLAMHNFASAAAGIAVAIALVRGFARHRSKTIGNFWVDVTRATVYVLLPISHRGRPVALLAGRDSESPSLHKVTTVEGAKQTIPQGPVASQEVIKNSAPTAADSSTPTRRIRSRIPRRLPICSRCS